MADLHAGVEGCPGESFTVKGGKVDLVGDSAMFVNWPAARVHDVPAVPQVWLVREGYGEWTPIAVYESLDEAKLLAPESEEWTEDRGIIRNAGPGRDLFIQPIDLRRTR